MPLFEYYMLKDEVWLAVHPEKNDGREAHLACVQSRLGRKLTIDDLQYLPVNRVALFFAGKII